VGETHNLRNEGVRVQIPSAPLNTMVRALLTSSNTLPFARFGHPLRHGCPTREDPEGPLFPRGGSRLNARTDVTGKPLTIAELADRDDLPSGVEVRTYLKRYAFKKAQGSHKSLDR
jgi:hypothetical protein